MNIWPADIPKIAFKIRYGYYEFFVMSFRLTNVPKIFMTLMNGIFKSFMDSFVIVCIHDMQVYSRSNEKHVGHFHIVLDIL